VVDDEGYAAEVYRNGPQAGQPAGHPDRASATRAARQLGEAGEAAVVTSRPPVRPADAGACCSCGRTRCVCVV
jgi:hypothetical protein